MTVKAKTKTKTAPTRRGFGRSDATSPKLSQPITTQPDITHSTVTVSPQHSEQPRYSSEQKERFSCVAQVRIDAQLFDSLNNAVESAIFGGNYSVESASHFVREALREHIGGKELKVAHQNGAKKPLSLRLDSQLNEFWQTLPKRHRNNILERAIRTKLLSYQT